MKKNHRQVINFLILIIQRPGIPIPITTDTKFSELDLDELDHVEIIMEIEKEFKISIHDDDIDAIFENCVTINDLKNFLRDTYDIFDIKEERKDKISKINTMN